MELVRDFLSLFNVHKNKYKYAVGLLEYLHIQNVFLLRCCILIGPSVHSLLIQIYCCITKHSADIKYAPA